MRSCTGNEARSHAIREPGANISGQPYFFSLLDAYLDARRISAIWYRGNRYDLEIYSEHRAFRRAAKEVLCSLSEHEANMHVSELKDDLHAVSSAIPDHAQPLTLADLIDLRIWASQLKTTVGLTSRFVS